MKNTKKLLAILFILAISVFFIFNPFGHHEYYPGQRSIVNTIEINSPIEKLYTYLGNSAHASIWSVYVDHITPLNPSEVPDGQVGSKRRCFQNADEQGLRWDETILINEVNKRRRISIYNLVDFSMEANGLVTEQLYEKIDDKRTNLVFSVFYTEKPDMITTFKTFIGSWYINNVFKRNMKNIKEEVEKER